MGRYVGNLTLALADEDVPNPHRLKLLIIMIDMAHANPLQHAEQLRIWQQNVNRSRMAHEDLLESLKTAVYNICAIQEPAINSFNNMLANTKWRVVYPKTHFQHPKKNEISNFC
jgi:hypothetical protein